MTDYFTVTRTISAPRELVFEALTKPEHFGVWFGTAAVEVPRDTLSMDVRPGGAFRAVMHLPDGNSIHWTGTYVEVEPPAHVAMTLTDQPGDDAGLPCHLRSGVGGGGHAAHGAPGSFRLLG
ncbi:MAG TPA: SRPBCC domain-containing protein [Microbacterium sp.]|nr:SRPBCC domain-containing protein [Microbacterium sp.]